MSNPNLSITSKQAKQQQCVFISKDVHQKLVSHVEKNDGIIYKFVERSIKEKIERDSIKS